MTFKCDMQLLRIYFVLIIFTLIYETFGTVTCPHKLTIEKGGKSTVSCTSEFPFVDVYWYRGPTSSTDPILWLQDGEKGGTEYGGDHYDITSLGQMVIKNASLDHEETYTFVAYFEGGKSDEANVVVAITNTFNTPCPIVSSCPGCESCHLNVSALGSLSCNVYEARPQIQVYWKIESQEKIDFIQYQPIVDYNEDSGSWNASAKLQYEAKSCGGSAILQCFATNQDQSTNGSFNTVYIFTKSCLQVNPPNPQGSSTALIICLVIIIIITLGIVGGTIFFLWHKRRKQIARKEGKEQKNADEEVSAALLPALKSNKIIEDPPQEDGDKKTTPQTYLNVKDPAEMEKKKESLVRGLKKYYQTFCDEKALSGKHKITTANLYTNARCLVITDKDNTEEHSSDVLFSLDCIKNATSVRLFGKVGYGKTAFAHHLLRQWIKKEINTTILIFLDMTVLQMEDDFFNCVMKGLSGESSLTSTDVENIVLEYGCLVLLDGCDEMTMVTKQNEVTEDTYNTSDSSSSCTDNVNRDNLKMKDFYDGNVSKKYPKLRMFMMARDTIQKKPSFPSPCVTVKLLGFSKEHADGFIDNFCKQWYAFNVREGHTQLEEQDSKKSNTNNTANTPNTENPEELKESDFARIFQRQLNQLGILEEKGILHKFGKIPLLLTAVAIVVADDVTNKDNMKGKLEVMNINLKAGSENITLQSQETKFTALVGKLVTFLESIYSDENGDILEKLGEVALHNKTQQYPFDSRDKWVTALGNDKMEIAMSAGFLEEDNILTQHAIISVINFPHQVFADYFAASSFPSGEEGLEALGALMKDGKDDKENMIFQFLCANNHLLLYKLIEFFTEYKMINNFINCLFEVVYPDNIELFRSSHKKWEEQTNLTIHHSNFYYQEALRNFCNLCFQCKTKLKTLTLQGFEVPFLVSLRLPELKQLEIRETELSKEGEFDYVTKWLTQQNISTLCRFIDCPMLEKLTEKSVTHIESIKRKNCHIERINKEVISKPNLKERGWKLSKEVTS